MINNAFAYTFKAVRLATTDESDLEHNKFAGTISTIMRMLTNKDSDLSYYFDKTGENTLDNNTTLKQKLINNYDINPNKGKIKCQKALENISGFRKTFKKITKNLRFDLTFKTTASQDVIFTTLANDFDVTIISFYLFVPICMPSVKTQYMFNESIKNNFTLLNDSWYTDRKIANDG